MKYMNLISAYIKRERRLFLYSALGGLVLTTAVTFGLNQWKNYHLQLGLSQKIVRLHVIAESDSRDDQELKLKVRDQVLAQLRPKMENCQTKQEAEEIIQHNITKIKEVAEATLHQQGHRESVQVVLQKENFPVKTYGPFSFPAGEYESLCIRIGKAQGHNWWCVMYPPLCFVEEEESVETEKSRKELSKVLSSEEIEAVEKPIIKFKAVEMWNDFWDHGEDKK